MLFATLLLFSGLAFGKEEKGEGADKAAPRHAAGDAGLKVVETGGKLKASDLSLKDFLEMARTNNPALKAAYRHWKMTEHRPAQVRSLEDPVLKYTEAAREVETRLGPVDRTFSLNQKLPFPGKLRLKGNIADKDAEIARVSYEKILRDLRAEVKKTYYELYFADMAVMLQKENEAVLEYFAEISRRNYGLDVSELDELVRAQKSSARATFGLLKARDMRKGLVARLNTFLDRAPDTEVGTLKEPDFADVNVSVDEMYEMAAKNNEMVRMTVLKVEKSELEKRLAGFNYKPNFSVGVNYAQIGEPPTLIKNHGDDAVSFSLGVSIPIWFGKNRAAVSEKTELVNKSRFLKRSVLQDVKGLVDKRYYNMSTAKGIASIYKDRFIPEAKESMDFAEARYKTGKESLGRLLETQSMWIDFRLLYYRAFVDYLKNIAELERLTAGELIK
ncbi:MAG: TolC family protein [Thermodesulfobacteriota bacterium]